MLSLNIGAEESESLPLAGELSVQGTAGASVRAEEGECPFVNRSDERCAEHLTMGGMGYAYDHCFGAFRSCSMYQELRAEAGRAVLAVSRDGRGSAEGTQAPPQVTVPPTTWNRLRHRLVELTVGRRRLDRAA